MRKLRTLVVALALALAAVVPAGAADPALDALFEKLQAARSPAEAQPFEAQIWHSWMVGGGPAATSLMQLGVGAMSQGNLPAALGIFDAIVKQNPDFAEGWNKRATLFYLLGQFDASMADIDRTLELEPRHFGALSGLGLIRAQQDRVDEAIAAYEKALQVHPQMEAVKKNVEALRKKRRDGAI